MKAKLIASSPANDFAGIKEMVSRYWFCKPDDITFETIKIANVLTSKAQVIKSGKPVVGFIINHKSNRIRFEYIGETP